MNLEKILPINSKRREFAKKIYFKIKGNKTPEQVKYEKWIKQNEPSKKELKKMRETKFKIAPKISIIVPLYNTPEKFLDELICSLQKQIYQNWELCMADGSPKPITYVNKYMNDTRIKY